VAWTLGANHYGGGAKPPRGGGRIKRLLVRGCTSISPVWDGALTSQRDLPLSIVSAARALLADAEKGVLEMRIG
jgi:hypothetical protein